MIQSKEDYEFYLEADRIALAKRHTRPHLFHDELWKFERLLRKTEYLQNCKKDSFSQIYFNYLRYRMYRLSMKFNLCIPQNVFGPGLAIANFSGQIIVSSKAEVGANCRISQCVTIGREQRENRNPGAPRIGNNVFIGPGAVIIGRIEIADDIAIGANSFVTKSFKEPGITIAGLPARKISDEGSRGLVVRVREREILEKRFHRKMRF